MITTDEIRKHIILDDGVEIITLRIENNVIIMTLRSDGATQSFRIRRTTDRGTTLQIIQRTCQLVTFIMRDPLLHRGIQNVHCFASDGTVHKADILFYNHKIDMLGFFRDNTFATRGALLSILRACEESSPTAVCAISLKRYRREKTSLSSKENHSSNTTRNTFGAGFRSVGRHHACGDD